jgi:hypothetical protein
MFARIVRMRMKPNDASNLIRTLENEVLPLLRKQTGFRDELILVAPDRKEAVGISLWNRQEDAEAYSATTYADVKRILKNIAEGTPEVETFEVAHSSAHKVATGGGIA